MPLASEDIVIDLTPAITLHPSLRAAVRLERLHGGYSNLLMKLGHGDIGALCAVIREGAGESVVTRWLDELDTLPLQLGLNRIQGPCIEFVFALIGKDDCDDTREGKPVTFEQYFTDLYRIATGWLGWTPDDAWNATPAEIVEAYKGRTAMLAAIFGGGGGEESKEYTGPSHYEVSPEERRKGLAEIASIGDLRKVTL